MKFLFQTHAANLQLLRKDLVVLLTEAVAKEDQQSLSGRKIMDHIEYLDLLLHFVKNQADPTKSENTDTIST